MQHDFKEYLETFSKNFDIEFSSLITNEGYPKTLYDSLSYVASTGGKRLRPFIVCESAALFDIPFRDSIYAAVAIEMIHCYSLIHDDLPAMDDDNIRRGHETLHIKFDEAIAILTGDVLLTDAFYIISKFYKDSELAKTLIFLLSEYSGGKGMLGGQILDLYPISENLKDINYMNKLKTGALIECSASFGAILGKADKNHQKKLAKFGSLIGAAFQITDDILDVRGKEEIIGKKVNKDKSKGKLTLIDHYGIDGAQNQAKKIIDEAQKIIKIYGNNGKYLYKLTDYIINRNK